MKYPSICQVMRLLLASSVLWVKRGGWHHFCPSALHFLYGAAFPRHLSMPMRACLSRFLLCLWPDQGVSPNLLWCHGKRVGPNLFFQVRISCSSNQGKCLWVGLFFFLNGTNFDL